MVSSADSSTVSSAVSVRFFSGFVCLFSLRQRFLVVLGGDQFGIDDLEDVIHGDVAAGHEQAGFVGR